MASTPAGAALTEAHRLAQLRLGAITVAQVHQMWPLLDLERLDATFPAWLHSVESIVGTHYQASALLAAGYFTSFRRLELGAHTRPFAPIVAAAPNAEALRVSMLVTGPVAVKSAVGNGLALQLAALTADAGSAGAAMRNVLAGGRDTLSQSVGGDPRALGWARAASGRACAFCAELASRGPVYSEDSVDFEAHDHCSCSSEPVYSTGQPWPDGSSDYRDLWNDATADVEPGGDLANTFRRALAARAG